ncbi:hypothetical protein ACX0MV_04785 [Pseudomonas borbori]
MRMMLSAALCLVALSSSADVEVRQPYWYVQLQCEGYDQCFASSNGSYTHSQSSARRFDDQLKAQRFMDSFTSSIRDKSPRLTQGFDVKCISDADARRLDLAGKPCTQ